MPKFPVDAPKTKVIKALERLGFQLVREGNHIAMSRENADGTRTPLTMPIIAQSRVPHCGPFSLNQGFQEMTS